MFSYRVTPCEICGHEYTSIPAGSIILKGKERWETTESSGNTRFKVMICNDCKEALLRHARRIVKEETPYRLN